MNRYEIKLQKRSQVGKGSTKQLRNQDMVPCEIYGGTENMHCKGKYLDFEKGIVSPHVYLFDIDVEGTKTTAIVQDVQYHPVTDKIIHVDFLAVNEKKPIKVKLPVELTGTSVGVIRGGKLRLITRKLYVKGLMKDLPPTVKIDITKLDVAHGIKVSDIKVEGLTFLDPKQTLIVKVYASRTTTAETEGQEQEQE